jgi:hypothetical protein
MPADFFTKPLQGQLFFKFRKAIMNEWTRSCNTRPQECVGIHQLWIRQYTNTNLYARLRSCIRYKDMFYGNMIWERNQVDPIQ